MPLGGILRHTHTHTHTWGGGKGGGSVSLVLRIPKYQAEVPSRDFMRSSENDWNDQKVTTN